MIYDISQATKLFELARIHGFLDPVSGAAPSCERELSAILCYFHQIGRIDWSRVPLNTIVGPQQRVRASEIVSISDVALTEFPLVACDQDQRAVWGGMSADLLFLAKNQGRVVLLENKVGSRFTYSVDPNNGQVGRQLRYLLATGLHQRSYILLSSGQLLDQGWYFNEVLNALLFDQRAERISGYIMRWEDVLAATTAE